MRTKALFLLVIFLLNYVVGIACALEKEIKLIPEEDHSHSTSASQSHSSDHSHVGEQSHHTEEAAKKSLNSTTSNSKDDNGCCTDEVTKFDSLDKNTNQFGKIEIKTSVTSFLITNYPSLNSFQESKGFSKYFANRQRPPNTNIRIFIQSFQI